MFRRLPDLGGEAIRFTIDGRDATGRGGDTVATALLAAGIEACRTTPVSGAPRGPYCMMGVCFECLVTIDGIGNRQGCLVALADGMAVETQRGARTVSPPRWAEPGPDGEVAGAQHLTEGDSPAGHPHPGSASPTRPSPPGRENRGTRESGAAS